ncbi:glycosyltransferase family 2 protein [Isoptericola sp. b408]|uniref:glycosyltransferase family 2 protein n=1 Tax=Isoptericola sp. b408 TaxID=3064653 RepID=UPI002712F37B|nr:glycosyltransferase family 2 protein [Isoptericola sp. b408]MDO8152297.1 glycosyltransferase family 2 protein [Isoptericola sp. b408]
MGTKDDEVSSTGIVDPNGAGVGLTIGITTYERPEGLARALESIFSQRLDGDHRVEVIVVDDGSKSEKFHDYWDLLSNREVDCRFSLIMLRNPVQSGGPSAGRNLVIDKATSDYILFMDDDDRLAEDSLGPLCDYLLQSDAQRISLRYRRGSRSSYLRPDVRHERLDIVESLWTMLPGSVYRTADVRHSGSRFPEGVHYGEDSEFVLHFSTRSENFAALCDRDYIIMGDPLPGESGHLSQGRGSWEDFLRNLLAHIGRFSRIIEASSLPLYVRDQLAIKALVHRPVLSYQIIRRISDHGDDDFATELLTEYSMVIKQRLPRGIILRESEKLGIRPEMTCVLDVDLKNLRKIRQEKGDQ